MSDGQLGLIQYIKKSAGKFDVTSMKSVRYGVSCLNYVLKAHNSELKSWAMELSHILIKIVTDYSKNVDVGQIEIFCDII